MFHRYGLLTCTLVLLLVFSATQVLAQGTGNIKGTVKDGQTGEPLPSANVSVVGTSLGAVTDVEGRFMLRGVPAGTRNLRASYLGYKPKDVQVTVRAGADVTQDFKMAYEGITGEGVTVTVQAEGQMQAINKQLSSMPVMNAVSAARIQELPDANAAESVSRLPGVSLVRTGGEGSKVVIRGLSPQFNQITVDGVELPSDVGSGNTISDANAGNMGTLGDRAAELSMISSSMLGGIEVIKAITPDMDATLIGGVVNFGLRKAAKGTTSMFADDANWLPLVELRASGGYNDLKNTYNDYKFVGSVEKRFFDEAFGVFVQVSKERRNLSNNALGANYSLTQKNLGDAGVPDLTSLSLTDTWRRRERIGGTVVLDYQHSTGEIGFMNFVNGGETRETHRGMTISQGGNGSILYFADDAYNETNVLSNLFSVKQDLALFHADLKLSHSYSESRNPEDLYFNFFQDRAGLDNLDLSKSHPSVLFKNAKPDINGARLNDISTSGSFQKERSLTGSLDLQTELSITDEIGMKVKFGGAIQRRTRDFDYNSGSGNQYYSGGGAILTAFQAAMPWLASATNGVGSMSNWSRGDYEYGEFLSGEYSLPYKIDPELMWMLMPVAKKTSSLEGYQVNKLATSINDYGGNETKSAGYLMATVNLGDAISILPGVRYQNLATEYTAMRGRTIPGGIQGGDTTVGISHGYWLPMVHVRYRPFEWLQLHFAYTNTLNYPDYSTITPRYFVGTNSINYNNWRINPARSQNFDLVASLYSNEIGLLSVNGFKKRIEDLIFFSHTYVSDLSMYPDLPQVTGNQLFDLNTYINNPVPIDIWGIETEWQTHFWFLPEPFNGIVFNINYTHIFSEASYPRSEKRVDYDDDGNAVTTIADTTYTTRMLDQPNDILNLAIGYDYMGFSMRLSLLYQDNIFKRPDFWMQNRINSDKFSRWDLSVKQELPWLGMQVFLNINNITGADDIDVNQKTNFPASEQRYGMSADAGLRIRF